MAVTQDIFSTEYTDFDNKNSSFDGEYFLENKRNKTQQQSFVASKIYNSLHQGSWFHCM